MMIKPRPVIEIHRAVEGLELKIPNDLASRVDYAAAIEKWADRQVFIPRDGSNLILRSASNNGDDIELHNGFILVKSRLGAFIHISKERFDQLAMFDDKA